MKQEAPARTTVYLKPSIYRALRVRSALTDRSLSDLVNDAVLLALREEATDAQAVRLRAREARRPFDAAIAALKRDKLL